jgi:hypothetical protein
MLGIGRRTFSTWVANGVITPVKIPGAVPRYRVRDLERIAERGTP